MKEGEEMDAAKGPCKPTQPVQKGSKLEKLKNKLKSQVTKTKAKDLPESLKLRGWQMLSNPTKKKNGNFMRVFLREHVFQLLGIFSLIVCAVLFSFQAYLAFRSFQMMNQLHNKPQIPEILYRIYFEGNDWAMNLDRVDLRANTSIFIH
ncbi:hypothetical protein ElyMa_002334100 [Elysia marginata]|uniref:Uncharacterized protein n=1 Tax=Elysia marginata TaxID=1093978 RepID=A0AAV4G849_9GAST|nr:hypothetical protein ElyMa_002334100 [Elysia marginata]